MNIEHKYLILLKDILDNGVEKSDRTGTGTISVFGRQIRHDMKQGFPLLTTKKMYWKGIVTELLWFLRGDTNIKFLVDNDCHIWDGDAYRNYEILMIGNPPERILDKDEFIQKIKEDAEIEHSPFTFAKKWGDLGPVYGKQWRSWTKPGIKRSKEGIPMGYKIDYIDQIANLINDLKTNPDSRRLMVNAWNVGELDSMVLPPCHYSWQVYTRELSARERTALGSNGSTRPYDSIKEENYKTIDVDEEMHRVCDMNNIPRRAISLMWNQRSVDTPLGLPFNIASYALLLEIIARSVNMVPGELIGNLGDCHIYKNQIDGVKEQLTRTPMKLPKIDIHPGILDYDLDKLEVDMFKLVDYQSHSSIKMPLSN